MSNAHIIKAKWMSTGVDPSVRNIGLDIIRAACAIFVVLAHTNNILGKHLPVYKFIFPLGSLAQEIFFSLSGFLIGTQLLKFINKDFKWNQLFVFYSKRWIRTVPFYFLFIGINYFVFLFWYRHSGLEFFSADFNLWPYFTFSQNLFEKHPVFYPEIWPIPVEEWSYLLIPVLLIPFCFISKGSLYKLFTAVVILAIIAANIVRIRYVLYHDPEQDWELRKIVAYRMDALLYGVLIAILVKQNESFFRSYKNHLFGAGLVICIITAFIGASFKSWEVNSALFTILPLFSAMMIPYFRFTDFRVTLASKFLTHISLVSYAILLSHLYFLQFLFVSIFRPDNLWCALTVTLVYFIALLLFSTLFYNFVERPVLRMRNT